MMQNNKNYLFLFITFFMLLEGAFFITENNKLNNDIKREEARLINVKNNLENTPIIARAYSIYDLTSNIKIYGKNDEISMPIASLAKSMSTIIALDNYKKNDEEIIISQKAISQAGDFGIFENEKWKIDDLARLTLICSANDGAYAMLENDNSYLLKMNNKAKRIGMNNTIFLNSTGLDLDGQNAGAFASALDANLMAGFALKAYPEIFNNTIAPQIILKSQSGFIHDIKNTNIILNEIPNIVFSKTGYTTLAGGNLTVIFKNKEKHLIAVTVLGSTFKGRFDDIKSLVNVLKLSYNE